MLEYLREYRTHFHVAQSWGVNESTAYRMMHRVETDLINSGVVRLPSRKKLLEADHELIIAVVEELPKRRAVHGSAKCIEGILQK